MTLTATGNFKKITLYKKQQHFSLQNLTLKGNRVATNSIIFQGDFFVVIWI